MALTLESETNDWDEAERLYLKSFELNPNYSLAHESSAGDEVLGVRRIVGALALRRSAGLRIFNHQTTYLQKKYS